MQIGHDQGLLMEIITRAVGAQRALEVGTFTGYSALAVARGLAPGGTLLCCDVSEEWTSIGREHWDKAGVGERIELRLGPALETLQHLPAGELFDLAFVDADKENYVNYYEAILPLLRSGGLLLADNTLWSGRVLHPPEPDDTDTAALQRFNDRVATDDRVVTVLLPIGDGVTVIQKR
jgi:caffeoyl-CoA O-methyltransferase